MHHSPGVLAILVLLSCARNVVSTFNNGYSRQSRLPRALSLPHQLNSTTLSSLLQPLSLHPPPDPWVYSGVHGRYRFSSFTEPSIQLLYLSSFLFTCLADVFDAIANQNFPAHQAYPGGRYDCRYTYSFPHGASIFALELVKVEAPNWDFTFADIGADLSAIFSAAQFFESPIYGVPEMKIDVFRYRSGVSGRTFLASQGGFAFQYLPTANVSVT